MIHPCMVDLNLQAEMGPHQEVQYGTGGCGSFLVALNFPEKSLLMSLPFRGLVFVTWEIDPVECLHSQCL
jgi:hypothetical protein